MTDITGCMHCACRGGALLLAAGIMPAHEPADHVAGSDGEWIMTPGWDAPEVDWEAGVTFKQFADEHPELVVWKLG